MLILAYKIKLTTKILIIYIMTIPIIVLNSYKTIQHTPVSLLKIKRSFLNSQTQIIFKIILPTTSPMIFAELRLSTTTGFVKTILAKLLISPTRIGDLITYHQSITEYPQMYTAIVSVIVMSALFLEILDRLEVILFRPEKRTA